MSFFSRLISPGWKWYVGRYLRKERHYRYNNFLLVISPGVFHPGFFSSSVILAEFVAQQDISGKKFLEMGSGSGLISMVAASKGANVTAADISADAVECTKKNSRKNKMNLQVFHSDLFNSLPPQRFDFVVANPPYYPKDPVTPADHAWYCGREMEYFERFFSAVKNFLDEHSQLIMVMGESMDIPRVRGIAIENGFKSEVHSVRKTFFEKYFIFSFSAATSK